jgi:hypothetical protein
VKTLLIAGVVVAAVIYGLQHWKFFESKVECPACLGTGSLLPDEEACGNKMQRQQISPLDAKHAFCFGGDVCPYCGGAKQVSESQAAEIPDGLYSLDGIAGEAAVLE